MGKGEIARDEQFLLVPQCFLPVWITFFHFHPIWNCRLQALSVWTSLRCVAWEMVNSCAVICTLLAITFQLVKCPCMGFRLSICIRLNQLDTKTTVCVSKARKHLLFPRLYQMPSSSMVLFWNKVKHGNHYGCANILRVHFESEATLKLLAGYFTTINNAWKIENG